MADAVLLVPDEGSPHVLLWDGRCETTPPLAWDDDGVWTEGGPQPFERDEGTGYFDPPISVGLVLAWDGEVVPEGVFRLWYMLDDIGSDALMCALYADDVVLLLQALDHDWGELPGRLILLDAYGREVDTPAEVV